MNYTKKNYAVFDDDEDFFEYAICKNPVILPLGDTGLTYFTFDYSKGYKQDTEKGIKFLIKGSNSSVIKHGAISYRTVTLPVSVEYYDNAVRSGLISDDDIIVIK